MLRSLATALLFLLIAAFCGFESARLVADEPAPTVKSETTRLLTVGWDGGSDAKKAADASYETLMKLAPGDGAATYSYALVLMKQRRYAEATQTLDRLLTISRDDPAALKARAWVGAISRQFGKSLVDIERVIALLPKENLEPDAELAVLETCRMLGRLLGFFEGPANDVTAANSAAAARERIAAKLSESRLAAFYAGRQSVLNKFADFGSEREKTVDENVAAAKENAERTKADLDKQREQNAAEVEKLQSSLERVQSDGTKELADLDAQAPPLQARLSAADAAAAQVQARIINLTNEIGRLQALFAAEKDPILRDRLLRDINRLRDFRAQIDVQLILIQREYNLVAGLLAQLANRRTAAAAKWNAEQVRVQKSLDALRKADTRIGAIERRLDQPVSGASPKTRALSAQATALSTYEAFPLDEERERLLAALK